jgi:ADP-L-glycero-D-manno-heptose 6-epimerase
MQNFDLLALQNGMLDRIAGLKYFNVYGPYEDHKGDMRSMINKSYGQILSDGELTLFKSHRPDYRDGEQERDFIYVKDAVAVTLFLFDTPQVNGIFNCGTGTARTWIDLARAVFAAMGKTPRIRFVDIPETIRDRYQYHTRADMAKLRAAGYKHPMTSIEDGVREYIVKYLADSGYSQ